jgi:hypothetical protein
MKTPGVRATVTRAAIPGQCHQAFIWARFIIFTSAAGSRAHQVTLPFTVEVS